MKKAKFVQLFNTLTASEIKAFEKHLQKNFSAGTNIFKVLKYIKKYKADEAKLNKEYALSKIFRKEKVAKTSLTNLLSDLNLALEEFLLWKKFKENKHNQIDQLKLEIWKERGLNERFNGDLKKIEQTILTSPPSIWSALTLTQLYDLAFYNANLSQDVARSKYLQAAIKNLDTFYFTLKLKYSSDLLNRNELRQEDNKIILFDEILNILESQKLPADSYLQLYYQLILLIKEKNNQHFHQLKTLFKKFKFRDPKEELIFLLYLANYTVWSYRNGQLEMGEEIVNIYQYGLNKNLMVTDKYFPPIFYKNIITIYCLLKKFEQAIAFNEKWHVFLPQKIRNDVYVYCQAAIAFSSEQYENCLQLLNSITFVDFSYGREGRAMIIRCFYELDNYSSALDVCNSYELYLRRSKIAGQSILTGGLNFIKIIKKMISGNNFTLILKEVQSTKLLQSKSWFLEKLMTK